LRSTARPTDGDHLTALAAWLDHASRWLEREVHDSRRAAGSPTGDDADPEQRVETVTFLTAELDAAVEGLRRATDVLAALAAPLPDPIAPTRGRAHAPAAKRPRARLRLVE
jgi:hypothetical protein